MLAPALVTQSASLGNLAPVIPFSHEHCYRCIRELSPTATILGFRYSRVCLAEDLTRPGQVVILKQPRSGLPLRKAAFAQQLFERERAILSTLSHPHISHLRHSFTDLNGTPTLVLDYIEGQTLEELLFRKGGRVPVTLVLYVGIQLCEILSFLHEQHAPIIHCDLKPANVLLSSSGQTYLIDFGIARSALPGQAGTNQRIGSYGYAAPEQYDRKGRIGTWTDLYSLGVLLHRMLSGNDPVQKPLDALFTFPPLKNPEWASINTLITGLLQREPARRNPMSATLVQNELEEAIYPYFQD
jgi:eukaryotic-like serine/threonine-protein kinase